VVQAVEVEMAVVVHMVLRSQKPERQHNQHRILVFAVLTTAMLVLLVLEVAVVLGELV
jgi:ABC-type Co2+ transport system permease subunit